MRSEIRVIADNGQEFKFDLEHAAPLTGPAGREWLDTEFTRLECEPLRPTGKLLLADKVVVVARAAGATLLSDAAWGPQFAAAAAAALGKPTALIDARAMSVSF
ncbi:hypothetical protein [Ottowia testudinis]|uniref:Uncharacterized protein n=1 Tax=Ottowia testudinis TaxID=2816950 RepID=A0A975CFG9_9BURK|nr:hypothetical protein [Ottowia testudinis]QTD44811.1 hypothetical protein J1M35_17315 [Ottowia testudinis]